MIGLMKTGLAMAVISIGLGLILPLTGCREDPPQPESQPLTQQQLEDSLNKPGRQSQEALKKWEAGKAERDAQMKAYQEELKRKEAQAEREREEFRRKHPQPGTEN